MGRCAVSFHFYGLLQVIYGRLHVLVAESSVANAFVESGLVDVVGVRCLLCLEGFHGVVIVFDGFLNAAQS